MPISFGSKGAATAHLDAMPTRLYPDFKLLTHPAARLIDVRTPKAFREAFIPGSYNIPDRDCMSAALQNGLFQHCDIYLLADDIEQLRLFSEATSPNVWSNQVAGWFGPDAIGEWRKVQTESATIGVISHDTLSTRVDSLNAVLLDFVGKGETRSLSHQAALRFALDELPGCLDGLPTATCLCLTARSVELASFAASIIWNFGFHRISCLD